MSLVFTFVLCAYLIKLFYSLLTVYLMQCILQASMGDSFDEELETSEVDEILVKLKSSVESDHRQAAVWNILGLVLLRGGQIQVWALNLLYFFPLIMQKCLRLKWDVIEELVADVLCVSRVLSQFYLLSRLSLQTTWTPLRILVLRTFKGLNYHFSCHFLTSDCNIFINFQWGSRAICKVLSRASSKRSKPPSCSGELCSSSSL